MAVTSIWSYKGSTSNLIEYIMNPEKTNELEWSQMHRTNEGVELFRRDLEESYLSYGLNVPVTTPAAAAEAFDLTRTVWNKNDGRLCYHAIQSFAPGEVSPEEAHELGIRFAEELWGDRYQVVISTHVNKQHIHNHFCINAVSYIDGRKLHFKQNYYEVLRTVSDQLCKEAGLSVIENPGEATKVKRKERAGNPNIRQHICTDIDSCIIGSYFFDDVLDELEKMGYEFKLNCKYPSLSPPGEFDKEGNRRFYRFKNLYKSEGYDVEDIKKRLEDIEYDQKIVAARRVNIHKEHFHSNDCYYKSTIKKNPGYYQRTRRIKIFGNNSFLYKVYKYKRILNSVQARSNRRGKIYVSTLFKEDMRKINQVNDAIKYVALHDIRSLEDVRERKVYLYNQVAILTEERKHLNNINNPEAAKLITPTIVKYRKEIEICQFVEKGYSYMRDVVSENEKLKKAAQNRERRPGDRE